MPARRIRPPPPCSCRFRSGNTDPPLTLFGLNCADGLVQVAIHLKIIPDVVRRHDEDINVCNRLENCWCSKPHTQNPNPAKTECPRCCGRCRGNGNPVRRGHEIICARIGGIGKLFQRTQKTARFVGNGAGERLFGCDLNHHAH